MTDIDTSIINSHRLSQRLLYRAVGLVVLLKLSLKDLDLFFRESGLCLSCSRHLVMVQEMALVSIVELHRFREISGITG